MLDILCSRLWNARYASHLFWKAFASFRLQFEWKNYLIFAQNVFSFSFLKNQRCLFSISRQFFWTTVVFFARSLPVFLETSVSSKVGTQPLKLQWKEILSIAKKENQWLDLFETVSLQLCLTRFVLVFNRWCRNVKRTKLHVLFWFVMKVL